MRLCRRLREQTPARAVRANLERFPGTCGGHQGSRRSPAKRVRWEEAELRNERVFALLGGNEGYAACDDEKQDKGRASGPPLRPITPSRSAGRGNGLREFQRVDGNGVKTERRPFLCGRYSPTPTPVTKKQGSCPGKDATMSKKEKFALYLTPEKKALLERRYGDIQLCGQVL